MYVQNLICICISSFCWISPSVVAGHNFNDFLIVAIDVVSDQIGLASEYVGFLVQLISVAGGYSFNVFSRVNQYLYPSRWSVAYLLYHSTLKLIVCLCQLFLQTIHHPVLLLSWVFHLLFKNLVLTFTWYLVTCIITFFRPRRALSVIPKDYFSYLHIKSTHFIPLQLLCYTFGLPRATQVLVFGLKSCLFC